MRKTVSISRIFITCILLSFLPACGGPLEGEDLQSTANGDDLGVDKSALTAGPFRLKNYTTSLCIQRNATTGALSLQACVDTTSQKTVFETVGCEVAWAGGACMIYQHRVRFKDTNMCLYTNSSNIVAAATCNSADARHKWIIMPGGPQNASSFKNKFNNLCMRHNSSGLVTGSCTNTDNRQFWHTL